MYLIYLLSSGEILRGIICPDIQEQLQEGEGFIETDTIVDDRLFYINSGSILPKQDYELDCLPLPCTITIEGVSYHITEQPTFEFDVEGEYIIEVDAGVEYLKKEFEYVVKA